MLIEGKLVHRSYEDSKGEKQFISEVQIQNFIKLDSKTSDQEIAQESTASESQKDDLPF